MMVNYTVSITEEDLTGILDLQSVNLRDVLTPAEQSAQGFVTIKYNYNDLEKLNNVEQHVIAKDGDKVAAYVLAITKYCRNELPVLIPMFKLFDEIEYNNRFISQYEYIVVGQVCVAKEYRGRGTFDNCYFSFKKRFADKYDFAITEIAVSNQRSLNAHKRIGFKQISTFTDPGKTGWNVVLWDWRMPA